MHEPSGKQGIRKPLALFEFRDGVVSMRNRPAAQVNGDPDANCIHDFHRPRQVLRSAVDMLVKVDEELVPTPVGRHGARGSLAERADWG